MMAGKFLRIANWILRVLILVGVAGIFYSGYFPVGIVEIVIVVLSVFLSRSRNSKVLISVFLILFLFLLNVIGILFLYKTIGLYDDILHVFGAIVLTYIVYSVVSRKFSKEKSLLYSFLVVLILILGWEFYEYVWDIIIVPIFDVPLAQPSFRDTVSDLIYGLIGNVIMLMVIWWKSY